MIKNNIDEEGRCDEGNNDDMKQVRDPNVKIN